MNVQTKQQTLTTTETHVNIAKIWQLGIRTRVQGVACMRRPRQPRRIRSYLSTYLSIDLSIHLSLSIHIYIYIYIYIYTYIGQVSLARPAWCGASGLPVKKYAPSRCSTSHAHKFDPSERSLEQEVPLDWCDGEASWATRMRRPRASLAVLRPRELADAPFGARKTRHPHWALLMYGFYRFYHHFNNLRFNKSNRRSMIVQLHGLNANEILKCRVLKWLSAPPTEYNWNVVIPVSVNKTRLLREPLPCNPAAETALQHLIWCSES